ncbi:DNA-processing protein DprA [Candidatus Saccharibacteria bacterium]|nr:DNA-processing protein DprA [Candidatus Saccharibacteria bacterium]
MKINEISPLEGKFTEVLSSIALTPKMLYYYGKIPEFRVPTVAIVGTRKCTRYGEELAYRVAYEVAKAGAIVVSGLAYGIDSVAHRGALDAGGITLAVLGTNIDRIYPTRHIGLAREIIEKGGAVISEYNVGQEGIFTENGFSRCFAEVGRLRFLARNRIISGLSDAVLVVEAAERSGSLNTAMHALEQGRELLAVPADITRVNSRGCNRLIQMGAKPYLAPEDLLETVGLLKSAAVRKKVAIGGSPAEKAIFEQINRGVRDGDEIIRKTGISAQEFSQAITMLEIRGLIRGLGMNKWMIR